MPTSTRSRTFRWFAATALIGLVAANVNACTAGHDIEIVAAGGAGGAGGSVPDDDGFHPGGGGGQPGGFEACAEASEEAKLLPINMFIAIDKSGSMDNNGKWTSARAAFSAFFTDPSADTLNVALRFWPQGNCSPASCSAAACSQPQVPLGSLADPAQEQALINLFSSTSPGGLTPMSAALAGATQWAVNQYNATDGVEKTVVVFLTDGAPTACNQNIDAISQYAADAYAQAEVLTFAVGLQGSNEAQLNKIAQAGNTNAGFFIGNGNAQGELLAALKAIQETSVACAFAMPTGDDPSKPVDPTKVNMTYTSASQPDAVTIPQVADEAACSGGDGWYYDDPDAPALLQLCEATCDAVRGDDTVELSILLGCDTRVF